MYEYMEKYNGGLYISDELRELLVSLGDVKEMKRNTYLFSQGMDAKEVYLIQSGIVQISMMSSEGAEMTLRICKQDDIVGELTLYCDNPTYLLHAKVIKSGKVIAVNIDRLHEELRCNHLLAIEMMKWISNHMRKYQLKMKDLLLNGKKGALFSTLIRLSNSYGVQQKNGVLIDIGLTNQQLANFCGASREYVNRMLTQLREKDVISRVPSTRMIIKDLEYLKNENNCERCPVEVCNIN